MRRLPFENRSCALKSDKRERYSLHKPLNAHHDSQHAQRLRRTRSRGETTPTTPPTMAKRAINKMTILMVLP
jgi:hypothetical protein